VDGKRQGLKRWRRLKELVEERRELLHCDAYHLFIATALNLVISSSIFRRNDRVFSHSKSLFYSSRRRPVRKISLVVVHCTVPLDRLDLYMTPA
jgi:hypothetical protein